MGKITTKQILTRVRDLMPAEAICLGKAHFVSDQQVVMLLRLLEVRQIPVDVNLLSQLLGADVVLKSGKYMQGKRSWSHWHEGTWKIEVCEDDSAVMRRYNIAREMKRVLDFSMAKIAYAGFKCKVENHYRQKVESLCDYFAACLLIPRRVLKRAWTAGLRDIACLAQHFLVPVHVMQQRVTQLGLVDNGAVVPVPIDVRMPARLNHNAVKWKRVCAGTSYIAGLSERGLYDSNEQTHRSEPIQQ